ncbi:MAG: glycosyltransferase [Desulfobacterales bacterium]|nr:glycosyltransferase [Desulfobacterales bacterium]
MIVDIIIPVLNEERALSTVFGGLPQGVVRQVVVVDNGSTDRSAQIARDHGARVVSEPRRGYGRAVWTGVEELLADPPEVVVFMDGDAADDPTDLEKVLAPIKEDKADLVIGSRMAGNTQKGSMSPAQKMGNIMVPALIRLLYGTETTDLGPFRAIRFDTLIALNLVDRGFGITVEMQIKAAKNAIRVVEVPVTYRPRIGESKISGTVMGTIKAALKILWVVAKYVR